MPRIVDVMKDLKLDQATFSKIYEKVMGKKFSAKVATVSDANLEKIKYVVDQLAKKAPEKKTTPQKKEDESKVLKSDEL